MCPICQQPGGMMYGRFHSACWGLMWGLDETEVHDALPDTLEDIARLLDETATHLRALDEADVVAHLSQSCGVLAQLRHVTGAHLMNLHQYRTLLFTRRTLMN